MVVHTHLPANKAYKKVFTRISNSFSPQLTFMCPCDFYRYEHYTNRKKEFQNVLERKFSN